MIDLKHLMDIATILEAIPTDLDAARASVVLEDVSAVVGFALVTGLPLKRACEIHREQITREETRRLLKEHGRA